MHVDVLTKYLFLFVLLHFEYTLGAFTVLNLPEGSKCEFDKYNGTCTKDYNCLSMIKSIMQKDYPAMCSYGTNSRIVCCTDCPFPFIADIRDVTFVGAVGLLFKNGLKAHDKCIEYVKNYPYRCKDHNTAYYQFKWLDKEKCKSFQEYTQAPVGGQDALRGEFPHMALLGYGPDLNTTQWQCGASLISENFVLTAAHCISSPKLGPVKLIALGILKRTDPIDLWRIYNVKDIIPHPAYESPFQYHDIALLKTETTVKIDTLVLPACLLRKEEQAIWAVHATGWGYLGPKKPLADTLQKVSLEKFSDEECSKLYPGHRLLPTGYDNATQVCYGDHNEAKDTCSGDSGGPLQNTVHKACQFRIIGVTSAGLPCGESGGAGLYTQVEPYLPWIESIVWP